MSNGGVSCSHWLCLPLLRLRRFRISKKSKINKINAFCWSEMSFMSQHMMTLYSDFLHQHSLLETLWKFLIISVRSVELRSEAAAREIIHLWPSGIKGAYSLRDNWTFVPNRMKVSYEHIMLPKKGIESWSHKRRRRVFLLWTTKTLFFCQMNIKKQTKEKWKRRECWSN